MRKLPYDVEGAFDDLREAAERMAEQLAPPKRGDDASVELGFQVEEVNPDTVRGNFDLSRLEKRNPRLVAAITGMLGMHYLPWDVIATMCRVDWQTVAAVAEGRKESIREFKGRMAKRMGLLMEAMTPVLLDKIRRGQATALDLKLVHEVWGALAGEATAIVERREGLPALQQFEQAMNEIATQGPGMGLRGGEVLTEGAPWRGADLRPVVDVEVVELGQANHSQSTVGMAQTVEDEAL